MDKVVHSSSPCARLWAGFASCGCTGRVLHPVGPHAPVPAFIFTKLPPAISRCISSLHARSNGEGWQRRQGLTEHFPHCPLLVRLPRCQRWSTLPVALRQKFATSLSWLHERYLERCMRTHTRRGGSPPFQVGQELWGGLRDAQVRRASAATP